MLLLWTYYRDVVAQWDFCLHEKAKREGTAQLMGVSESRASCTQRVSINSYQDFFLGFSFFSFLFIRFPTSWDWRKFPTGGSAKWGKVTWPERSSSFLFPPLRWRDEGRPFCSSIWFTIMIIWPLPNWTCRRGQEGFVSFSFGPAPPLFFLGLTSPWKWIHRLSYPKRFFSNRSVSYNLSNR